jgi:hypothetical protein
MKTKRIMGWFHEFTGEEVHKKSRRGKAFGYIANERSEGLLQKQWENGSGMYPS